MYIHKMNCISAQHTSGNADLETLLPAVDNKMYAKEPAYEGMPPGMLRRMGRAVRMGVGCALPLVKDLQPDAIIVGTANGGMEDCIKFLNQIMDYEEGMLTPGNFVQSTPNATAAQLGLMTANRNYNITHVHRGLAFENALLDVMLLLKENPQFNILLEGLDEISDYNYNIDFLDGWYKEDTVDNRRLYDTGSKGTLAGEGAAAFIVNGQPANALARVIAVHTMHTQEEAEVAAVLQELIDRHLPGGKHIDILIAGENGDSRYRHYYDRVYSICASSAIVRYKHMFGEFGTASALALWLACQHTGYPAHAVKQRAENNGKYILIYNMYHERQHGVMLVERL